MKETKVAIPHEECNCEFRSFLDRVADKWSLLLIATLERTPNQRSRFSNLKNAVPGISQRMLTTTLRNLERDGLVVRHYFPEIPPRVEYELSPLGKNLMCPIGELMQWIRLNWETIKKAREYYDQKQQ
ncbi:winged helix-turn-helix transcriptional regulator [Legionella fallonii]|uniref:Transcriptional regulator, HxlR family n=1 Tax=Legionella fallonii LLAP-10 TaxID=1212491 RepID=A0A098G7V6_9GAMM|nr:helix-turn-helix domain-containing protein [Legionella fallonii]CEG58537.1 Transcriptional regulator, HxlR family [Legionella fallonii LLAP-10]